MHLQLRDIVNYIFVKIQFSYFLGEIYIYIFLGSLMGGFGKDCYMASQLGLGGGENEVGSKIKKN